MTRAGYNVVYAWCKAMLAKGWILQTLIFLSSLILAW